MSALRWSSLAVLLLAVGAGGPAPLPLVVKDGDTPSGLLIEHFQELRGVVPGLARGTARDLAYRLLARSPDVAGAVLHPGDRLVVLPGGRLRLDSSFPRPEPAPPVVAPAPVVTAPPAPEPVALPPPEPPAPPPVVVAPPPPPPPPPPFELSGDGRRVLVGERAVMASGGLTVFERGGLLHVVRLQRKPFDVSFPAPAGGAKSLEIPPNPFVRLSADGARLVPADSDEDPAPYVARGELNIHEDHLHLTAKFPLEAWRQLYAARNDTRLDALRQKAAAALIVKLLEVHIDRDPARFGESLGRTLDKVEHVWRAFDRGVEAREIVDQLDLGYEVAPDGRTVEVGDEVFVTAAPLRFESCTGHFHVLGLSDDHRFAAKVEVKEGAPFAFPRNPFFTVTGNIVVPLPPMPLWMGMVRQGALEQRRGHYHLTEKWAQPSVAALAALLHAPRPEVRDEATAALFRVLSVPVDPADEEDLRRVLAQMGALADGEYARLAEKANAKGWPLDR